jgi:hypothetical protein
MICDEIQTASCLRFHGEIDVLIKSIGAVQDGQDALL